MLPDNDFFQFGPGYITGAVQHMLLTMVAYRSRCRIRVSSSSAAMRMSVNIWKVRGRRAAMLVCDTLVKETDEHIDRALSWKHASCRSGVFTVTPGTLGSACVCFRCFYDRSGSPGHGVTVVRTACFFEVPQ